MASFVGISVVFKPISVSKSLPFSHLNVLADVSLASATKSTSVPSQIIAGNGSSVTSAFFSTFTLTSFSIAGHLSPVIVNLYVASSVGISEVDKSASLINSLPFSHLNLFVDEMLASAIKSTFSPSHMIAGSGCSVTSAILSTSTIILSSISGHASPKIVNLYVAFSSGISVVTKSTSLSRLPFFSHLYAFDDGSWTSATKSIFSPLQTTAGSGCSVISAFFSTSTPNIYSIVGHKSPSTINL